MMPAILLSGVMTPIRAMPDWLQYVTYLNPVRYFAEVMRGVLLRGAGLGDLWFQLAALAVLGAGILGLAASRFRTQLG
jgi:ABC-2 type transport system permease protein